MNLSVGVVIGREISSVFRRGSMVAATARAKEDDVQRRRAVLRMVDRQLNKGNFKMALSLVKQLQRHSYLAGFAAARQVPRRVSSVEQLHLSMKQTSALQPLFDAILDSIKCSLQSSPLEENSVSDEDNELFLEDDIVEHTQVVQHEAGHFLIGYLLGVLPKQYKFSSMGDHIFNASVKFVGFEFLTELEDVVLSDKNLHEVKAAHQANKRKLSSTVLSKFACVIVGGLVAEHLAFGHSKGHQGDVDKLCRVLKWLQFTEDEASILTRWAALNTLTILYRHTKATSTLAGAMTLGRSIGNCIDVIEGDILPNSGLYNQQNILSLYEND